MRERVGSEQARTQARVERGVGKGWGWARKRGRLKERNTKREKKRLSFLIQKDLFHFCKTFSNQTLHHIFEIILGLVLDYFEG